MPSDPVFLFPSASHIPIGVSLKTEHYESALNSDHDIDFFEIHAENYMMPSGPHMAVLSALKEKFPISIHGVGLSLGSAEGINDEHLDRFAKLVANTSPWLVSEHLAWSVESGGYLNDLLPLPLTMETFAAVKDNLSRVQDKIGRQILIENPSSYLGFKHSDIPEAEFLVKLAEITGCGLLLDINNVYVSSKNMGWSATDYLNSIPACHIGEIHLAGHLLKDIDGVKLRIDDHGREVCDDVWSLYEDRIENIGIKPTLIEWDSNIPDFKVFETEVSRARTIALRASSSKKKVG